MFYYVLQECAVGTAQYNRAYANLNVLDKEGIKTTVVFLTPYKDGVELDSSVFSNINVIYLYKQYPYFKNRLFEIVIRFMYPILFSKRLKEGDVVYIYNCEVFLHYILKKKSIRVYHERTEHPDCVWGNSITTINKKTYYKDCLKLDGLFVISTCLRDLFMSKGLPADKVTIVNMTVDESRFDHLVKQSSNRYFAYCGVIYNNKDGVDRLIKSFSIVAKTHPDVQLWIIGPTLQTKEAEGNELLIAKLGLKERIILTGFTKPDDIPQILKNATACVLSRPDGLRAKAGFATKVGEYLLSENPVILTDVGDFSKFLKDGESALIVEPENTVAFADKMNWVLDNGEEAKKVGENGAIVARVHFNSRIEAQKMIDIMFH